MAPSSIASSPPVQLVENWLGSSAPRLLCVSIFAAYPPRSGGHMRIFHLLSQFAHEGFAVLHLSEGVRRTEYLRISATGYQISAGHAAIHRCHHVSQLGDALLQRWGFPPLLRHRLRGRFWRSPLLTQLAQQADIIQLEQPWLFPPELIRQALQAPLVLDAHNIEADLYATTLPRRLRSEWEPRIRAIESAAFSSADLALVCSQLDAERANKLYGIAPDRLLVAPNGADLAPPPVAMTEETRHSALRALGLYLQPVVLFIGSDFAPNIAGLRTLIEILAQRNSSQDFQLVVLGSAARALPESLPDWVRAVGFVEDLRPWLNIADVAVNPMLDGSGTNLKMLDYMHAGLPIVSTAIGSRGLDLRSGEQAAIHALPEFPDVLACLLADPEKRHAMGTAARSLAQTRYAWGAIAARTATRLRKLIEYRQS